MSHASQTHRISGCRLFDDRYPAQTLPQGVRKGASLAGITEYTYPNGLRVLLLPDSGSCSMTVNIVYLVGSRHEGYGETGMAHLLEHLNFIKRRTTGTSRKSSKITAHDGTARRTTTARTTSKRSMRQMKTCDGLLASRPSAW
jgi:zinc protease